MAVDLVSNVKLATSGATPTTANLPKGYMAFGNFGGKNEVYGNVGSQVVKLNSDPKKALYFASQTELDTFLKGSDVPVGEWYAAVADKVYPKEAWASFNFSGQAWRVPYDAPITAADKGGDADMYFALSDEGYQILAQNEDTKETITVELEATAPRAGQISNVNINVIFVGSNYNPGGPVVAYSDYTWTVQGVWNSSRKAVVWSDSTTINNWTPAPRRDGEYGYLYITLMQAESALDVTGTITLRKAAN